MRENHRIREILRALSSGDLALRLSDGDVAVLPRSGKTMRLRLKVIRGRGPEAAEQASPQDFNLFIDAGPRLTEALRNARRVKAIGTSTGLLKLRLKGLIVDVERPLDLPQPRRQGPRLRGLSELVAEALVVHPIEQLPPLQKMQEICAGALENGPSIAQIQKVLARLEAEDLLKADRARGRRYTRYFDVQTGELLRRWAGEYLPSATRSLAVYVTARDAEAVLSLLRQADLRGRWAVAGPAAAQLWRPTLTRAPVIEIWADEEAWDVAMGLGAPVDDEAANLIIRRLAGGHLPLWYAHHRIERGLPLISPARAFVETSSRTGPLLDELADALLGSIT